MLMHMLIGLGCSCPELEKLICAGVQLIDRYVTDQIAENKKLSVQP